MIRFDGFGWTCDYRPYQDSWESPYRVRIVTDKNERYNYRIVAYGSTENEAYLKAQVEFDCGSTTNMPQPSKHNRAEATWTANKLGAVIRNASD